MRLGGHPTFEQKVEVAVSHKAGPSVIVQIKRMNSIRRQVHYEEND
jgi:hypothetical protein